MGKQLFLSSPEHKALPAFLSLIFFFATAFIANGEPLFAGQQQKNVLLLSSYHVGYKWSDDIHRGIMDVLHPLPSFVDIHIEYMDMKRHYSEDRFDSLFYSFSEKYKNINIDYVISADDAAFIFLKNYRSMLFPKATVIFCGTNYLEQKDLDGLENYFGVTEKADILANFDLMFSLHPDTQNIYIINDQTITGNKIAPIIAAATQKYSSRARFTFLNNLSMEELLSEVRMLPPHSLIFYTFFLKDSDDTTIPFDESISRIAEVSEVPIYGAWDFNLGLGIVGGKLTSGYQQGAAAGRLALQLLQGSNELPAKLNQSPNRYMFDYRLLEKYSIPLAKIPNDAIYINKPESFVDKHGKVLLFATLFSFCLIIIIFALILNIGLRKKVEKKLQQSEKNFRGIFENAVEGLFQASLNGRFLRVNPALAEILKCNSPNDVIDYYHDLKTDLYVDSSYRNHLTRQILENGSAQQEVELFCKDGSKISVLLYCHNVLDEKGRHLYLEGSITDMTEYKMTQETIIQTEKMLSLGGLSAGIAHEIKNPLTSVMQSTQIIANRLQEDIDANRQHADAAGITLENLASYLQKREIPNLLHSITDSCKRANIIIEDMLSFSKKSIGEFALVPLADIFNESLNLAKKNYSFKRGYSFSKILIEYHIEEVPPLYCSRSKLCQVVYNILKNSAEAMGEAETENPKIVCSIHSSNGMLYLEIKDNGPGMDQNVKERIFEPFYTTKGGKKGTGLGLSIGYYIVTENHKGNMTVESTPGKGARFSLSFPLRDKAEELLPSTD